MNTQPPLAPASQPSRRSIAVVAAAVVIVAVVAVLVAARGPGPGATPGAVSVSAGSVDTVDLQGVPGQLVIVGAPTNRVTLTGRLHWTGDRVVAATRRDSGHVLRLSYRCATASPCTEDYRLVVPRRTAIVLRQPAGHVIVSGLAGSLRIIGHSINISATALRCPSLAIGITSGHMSATFDAAPRRVAVTLTSAQATLRLPTTATYAVTSQVTSGYVHVGVPQAAASARTVAVSIDNGELELLPR